MLHHAVTKQCYNMMSHFQMLIHDITFEMSALCNLPDSLLMLESEVALTCRFEIGNGQHVFPCAMGVSHGTARNSKELPGK